MSRPETLPETFGAMTFGAALRAAAARDPHKIAVIDRARTLTSSHLADRVSRLRDASITALGVKQGDNVGIVSRNRAEFIEVVAALPDAGAAVATINPRLVPGEIAQALTDCGARLVFVDPASRNLVEQSGVECLIVEFGPDYETLLSGAQPPASLPRIEEWDAWTIPYTSGTGKRVVRALSVCQSAIYIGPAIATALGGLMLATLSPVDTPLGHLEPWQQVFVLVGLPGILVALLVLTIREPARRGSGASEQPPSFAAVLTHIKAHRGAYGLLIAGLCCQSIMWNGATVWLPTHLMRTYGWTPADVALHYAPIIAFFGISGTLAGGWFAGVMRDGGHSDSNIRICLIAALTALPFGAIAPLMPTATGSLTLIAIFFFLRRDALRRCGGGLSGDNPQPHARPSLGDLPVFPQSRRNRAWRDNRRTRHRACFRKRPDDQPRHRAGRGCGRDRIRDNREGGARSVSTSNAGIGLTGTTAAVVHSRKRRRLATPPFR